MKWHWWLRFRGLRRCQCALLTSSAHWRCALVDGHDGPHSDYMGEF